MAVRHADLYKLFSKILPNEELLYHSPLPPHRSYDPSTTRFVASHLILSLTPSEAVYSTLSRDQAERTRSILFLHRPFRLDRKRIPHGTLVLSSHVRYDELLTTGWNEALADEQSVLPTPSDGKVTRRCIQGYKNDPGRRIGLVGLLDKPQSIHEYAERLSRAFEGHEALHTCGNEESQVKALACLNAFNPEIIDCILHDARSLDVRPEEVLCLTGAVRDSGIDAAKEIGMSVLAVGHRRCELWGLKYLEREVRREFPDLHVTLHLEEEEPLSNHSKNGNTRQKGGAPTSGRSGAQNEYQAER